MSLGVGSLVRHIAAPRLGAGRLHPQYWKQGIGLVINVRTNVDGSWTVCTVLWSDGSVYTRPINMLTIEQEMS